MRHNYQLSTESIKVLTGCVGDIADEMQVKDKYIYAILAGTETDPFAKFFALYMAAVRAGAPVTIWEQKLAAYRVKYEKSKPLKSEIECLTDKILLDADTTAKLVDALQDGAIDGREAERIQMAIAKERQNLEILETHLGLKRDLEQGNGFAANKAPHLNAQGIN